MIKLILLCLVVLLLCAALGLLIYGATKVQKDGTLLIVGEAVAKAPAERAFDRILSVEGLKAWWLAKLDKVEASPGWPAPGETLRFAMGKSEVTYTAEKNERPALFVAIAEYPDARSVVTQEFVANGAGTLYRKTVHATPRPGSGALKKYMLGAIIGFSVPAEAKRAAAFAGQ